jgi:hypothetical protein
MDPARERTGKGISGSSILQPNVGGQEWGLEVIGAARGGPTDLPVNLIQAFSVEYASVLVRHGLLKVSATTCRTTPALAWDYHPALPPAPPQPRREQDVQSQELILELYADRQ